MIYILGIITGIGICIFLAILNKKLQPVIEKTIKQTESKLKSKGSILEVENETVIDWLKK